MLDSGAFSFIFQSTPPVKAATCRALAAKKLGMISIHAAREGGDYPPQGRGTPPDDFNPRRP